MNSSRSVRAGGPGSPLRLFVARTLVLASVVQVAVGGAWVASRASGILQPAAARLAPEVPSIEIYSGFLPFVQGLQEVDYLVGDIDEFDARVYQANLALAPVPVRRVRTFVQASRRSRHRSLPRAILLDDQRDDELVFDLLAELRTAGEDRGFTVHTHENAGFLLIRLIPVATDSMRLPARRVG